MTKMTNEQYLLAAQKGDIKSFELLYEEIKHGLYAYIFNLVRHEADAIELFQETMEKVYRNIKMYRADYKASTWIWTIARNNCYDYFRKNKVSFKNIDEHFEQFEMQEESDYFAEDRKNLRLAIEKLNPSYRDVIALRIFNEYDYAEIAEVLGVSVPSVKGLIFKAKKKLKEILTEEFEYEK